jgi:hypothetical protein
LVPGWEERGVARERAIGGARYGRGRAGVE